MPKARNGQAMRAAYEAMGLTREQFARRVRLTPSSITNIAAGGVCSRPSAVRIASELGWLGPDALFMGTDEAEASEAADQTSGEATAPEPEAEASIRGVA